MAMVDGAAFGADIQQYMRKRNNIQTRCILYASVMQILIWNYYVEIFETEDTVSNQVFVSKYQVYLTDMDQLVTEVS